MKKYIYYLISLMLILGYFYIPRTYARANAMDNAAILEGLAQDNSGNTSEDNVVQDLELEDVGESEITELSKEPTGTQSATNNNERRIDYSELLSGMNIFPEHTGHNECGMVGMGVLLQFYNDLPTQNKGLYIPDNMNYAKGVNPQDKQEKANALRDDLIGRTSKFLDGWFGLQNATSPDEQFDGLVSYRGAYCQGMGITVNEWFLAYGMKNKIVDLIENNTPVLVTALSFSYEDGTSIANGGEPHAFVVYGYRYKNGNLQFLSHLGWDPNIKGACADAARWVNIDWLAGFVFLSDIPLSNFTATRSANGEETYITGLENENFSGDLIIPSQLLGRSVKKVKARAFLNCENLQSVTINAPVEIIEEYAFSGCVNLASINLPSTLEYIESGAFVNTGLISLTIPDGVIAIDYSAFLSCKKLERVYLSDSVTYLGEYAFCNCQSLVEVVLSSNLTEIKSHTFEDCYMLEEVILPNSITAIGEGAFKNCLSLTTVEFSDNNLNKIEKETFYYCKELANIQMPDFITEIGEEAFYACGKIGKIDLPMNITTIKNRAFSYCSSLEIDKIPRAITFIGESAFLCCRSLTSLTVPKDIETIESNAFTNPVKNIVLYVQYHKQRPSGWSATWAPDCTVVWGTELDEDSNYVVSFSGPIEGNADSINNPVREGYVLVGWYDPLDTSGTLYTSQTIKQAPNATYYVRWQAEVSNIVYKDVGGGHFSGIHGDGYPTTHTYGLDTVLVRPSRLDYTFIGWYLNPEGTGMLINKLNGADYFEERITLYAKWKKVTFKPVSPTSLINDDMIAMITENGSYIDCDGNVYLVEEDVEAYLNGTLTFYKKDDNLETI